LAVLGVRVFFVISGYLITRLLLDEQEKRGSICLSMFYFRRIFRILVPYYVFLIAMPAAARLRWVEVAPGDLGYALSYIGHDDPLAVGCLLAGISDRLWQDARYRSLLKSRWFILVPLAVLATVVFEQHPRFAFTIATAVISIGVALCVDRCVRLPGSIWTKAL